MEVINATKENVEVFTNVLIEAADWLNLTGQPMWKIKDLSAVELLKKYSLDEMKLCYEHGNLIGVFVLQWNDSLFWSEIKSGESGYLHKLAVCNRYRGKNYGNKIIQSAETLCRENNLEWLRLNCGTFRPRLRNFYENAGFRMVDRVFVDNRDQIRYEKNLYIK